MTQPAADLTALEHDFATWRAQRSRGSRIPAELWGRAASAAKTHGVSRISQRLNLDYYALKRRAEPSELAGSQPAEPFVEISLPAVTEPACVIEITDPTGARLRLELRHPHPDLLPAVLEHLWRKARQ